MQRQLPPSSSFSAHTKHSTALESLLDRPSPMSSVIIIVAEYLYGRSATAATAATAPAAAATTPVFVEVCAVEVRRRAVGPADGTAETVLPR